MGTANSALPHLTAAAQSLNAAFAKARESGCDVASQIIGRAMVINASAIEQLINPLDTGGPSSSTEWTPAKIAARRLTGDALVTVGDWAVSYDTSSETGKLAHLACIRYGTGASLVVIERDVRDGDTFATKDDAECYALNAGRLRWFSERHAHAEIGGEA